MVSLILQVFDWFSKFWRGARDGKKSGFGDGLGEPIPLFSFVFSWFPWLGGAGESKDFRFSMVFQGFGVGARNGKKKGFGYGLGEPKPSFSFVFYRFPWPGGV